MKAIRPPPVTASCAEWAGACSRLGAGVFEILLFPFPIVRGNLLSRFLETSTHWIHAGYKEFPPELGNESKYPYVRDY